MPRRGVKAPCPGWSYSASKPRFEADALAVHRSARCHSWPHQAVLHIGNQQFRRQPAAGRAVIAVVSHLCGTVGWVVTQIGPASVL